MALPLGPYVLQAPVGRGGMGVVWRAVHEATGVPLAVKVLGGDRATDPVLHAAFRTEVRAVAALDHPHIVRVHDHGELPDGLEGEGLVAGSPYLVMEWASEGTLRDRLPLRSWAAVRRVIEELLLALGHAHARGVVHRDLKPDNVLQCGHEDVRPGTRLADFGIARLLETPGRGVVRGGTPAYMAPEQVLRREEEQGPWTDLYALGCLAWRLVSGVLPFDGGPDAVLRAHLREPLPPLVPILPVPAGLDQWLAHLLEKAPTRRFRLAADALAALRELPEVEAHGPLAPLTLPPPVESTSATYSTRWRDADGPLDGALPAAGPRPPRAPLDASWQGGTPDGAPPLLRGTGLGLHGLRPVPLVGREVEQDRLWNALMAAATHGRARAVVIEGPAGIGKSRLARWLSERAHETGVARSMQALFGASLADDDPLVTMVARFLGVSDAEAVREAPAVRHLLADDPEAEPLVQRLIPLLGRAAPPAPAAERHAVLRSLLARLARERPLVVHLDDVAWSADAIRFATGALQGPIPAPVLLVLTARTEALTLRPGEREALAAFSRAPDAERLALGPLDHLGTSRLVHGILPLEPALVARVVERTGGNPLFAEQLVEDWVQRDLLVPGRGGYHLTPGARPQLPRDLRVVWRSRLEPVVPDEAWRPLRLAALLGHEVDAAEWREACRRDGREPPVDVVERLHELALVQPGADGLQRGWRFAHGMLRDGLLQEAADLPELHAICAEVLQARGAAAARVVGHLQAAGQLEDALALFPEAFGTRIDASDYDAAGALLEGWRGALEGAAVPPDDPRHGALLRAVAMRESHLGNRDAALEALDALLAHSGPGWAPLQLKALSTRMTLLRHAGRMEDAFALLPAAEALARQVGDLGPFHQALVPLLVEAQRSEQAREVIAEGLAQAGRCGDVVTVARLLRELATLEFGAGRLEEAAAAARAAKEQFEASGVRWAADECINVLGDVARAAGQLDAAEGHYRELLPRLRAIGAIDVPVVEANLALVLLARDRLDEADALLARSARELEARGLAPLAGAMRICRLVPAARRGDWDAWDRLLEEARALLGDPPLVDPDLAEQATRAGRLAVERGEPARAMDVLGLARAQWEQLGVACRRAEVEAALARCAKRG